MHLDRALKIFGLSPRPTKDEATKRYRELVKLYHPDNNTQDILFSNLMMTKVNSAYELIIQYIESPASARQYAEEADADDDAPPQSSAPPPPPRPDSGTSGRPASAADTNDVFEEFSTGFEFNTSDSPIKVNNTDRHLAVHPSCRQFIAVLCDHICNYYTDSMDNIPLRASGSTHTQYNVFIKKYKINLLKFRNHITHGKLDSDPAVVLFTFLLAFYSNSLLNFFYTPNSSRIGHRINQKYARASATIDDAICLRYCMDIGGTRTSTRNVSYNQMLSAHKILTELSESSPVPEFFEPAKTKLRLLDSFLYSFYWNYAA